MKKKTKKCVKKLEQIFLKAYVVVTQRFKSAACECGLFGKGDSVECGLADSGKWKDLREQIKESGYEPFARPSIISRKEEEKVKVTLRCVDPPCPEKSVEVAFDETFEAAGYASFPYHLPNSTKSVEKLEFELTINGKKEKAIWKRKVDSVDEKQKAGDIHVHSGGTLSVNHLANGFSQITVSGNENNYTANAAGVKTEQRIIEGDTEGLHGVQLKVVEESITYLPIGVLVEGDLMNFVVEKDTNIPTAEKRMYCTSEDNQNEILFQIFEGASVLTKRNKKLGDFQLTGLPPRPRDQVKVEVSFDIDNGILKVTAVCQSTDPETGCKVEAKSVIKYYEIRLDRASAEAMIEDAEVHEEEDSVEMARIDAWKGLKSLAHDLKWSVCGEQPKHRLSDEDKAKIKEECQNVINWIRSNKELEKDAYLDRRNSLQKFFDSIVFGT